MEGGINDLIDRYININLTVSNISILYRFGDESNGHVREIKMLGNEND